MRRLKKIMEIKDYDGRVRQLSKYAKELGISITRTRDVKTGKTRESDESLLSEKIYANLSIRNGLRMWWVAFFSAIASICSAIAAWVAVLQKNNIGQ